MQVRTAAEVGEGTALVEGDLSVFQTVDEFQFVLVALLLEIVESLGLGHLAAHELNLLGGQLLHLLLDFREIVGGDVIIHKVDVVVEAGLDMGTDTEFYARVQRLDGGGHQVGGTVPEGVLAFAVVPGVEGEGGILVDGFVEFYQLVVHFGHQDVAGQAFADGECHLIGGGPLFHLLNRAVRQCYINHNISML